MPKYPITVLNSVSLPQFQDWTDQYGMMTDNDQGNSTGNGNLYMAHYAFGLQMNEKLTDAEKSRMTQVFINNFQEPGLLNRLPFANNWYQAHDDMLGVMGADALMNPQRKNRGLTKLLYRYGTKTKIYAPDTSDSNQNKVFWNKILFPAMETLSFGHIKYVWNNVRPGKFHTNSWLGRRIELIATMQMASESFVNPVYWVFWAISMLALVYGKKNLAYQDGYILRFHSALACEGYGSITDWVCKKVRTQVKKDYGGFGEMLSKYFNKPNHPIVALTFGKN